MRMFPFRGCSPSFRPLLPLLLSLLLLGVTDSAAQSSNVWRGMVSTGLYYERGLDATLSVERETKYHNAWEFFLTGYLKWETDEVAGHVTKKSFWNSYNTWCAGVACKPCVSRGRNRHGNLRLGASFGSDTDHFIAIIHVGYEHSYALKGGWALFWQVKEEVAICARDLFRTGGAVGIKVPL